jgi:hypothetical protein
MNTEQREILKSNMVHVTDFLLERTHRLLLNNHIAHSSAGVDVRQIKGEMPVMDKGKMYQIEFELTIKAVPR